MTSAKRLTQIESSLTPKQAILLWLQQEHQGKSSEEYARYNFERGPSWAPRQRVEEQVVEAVRKAMSGQDRALVQQATRQAHMQADLLILLVRQTNIAVVDDSRARRLHVALLYEQLRNLVLSKADDEAMTNWMVRVRNLAVEVLSVSEAVKLVRQAYFDGAEILFTDTTECLECETKGIQILLSLHEDIASKGECPEFKADAERMRAAIGERASRYAEHIVTLAKLKMLDDFGETEAADALFRSSVLNELESAETVETT